MSCSLPHLSAKIAGFDCLQQNSPLVKWHCSPNKSSSLAASWKYSLGASIARIFGESLKMNLPRTELSSLAEMSGSHQRQQYP